MAAGVCAATIGLAGSSHADVFSQQFQSPSGDISCNLVYYPPLESRLVGKNFVQCDVANHSWVHPQPPPQGRTATSTFVLIRGRAPVVAYGPGAVANPDPMDDGAMKCTDASTGHFFRVSQESYELG
jgi:hypothetical protein